MLLLISSYALRIELSGDEERAFKIDHWSLAGHHAAGPLRAQRSELRRSTQ